MTCIVRHESMSLLIIVNEPVKRSEVKNIKMNKKNVKMKSRIRKM